VRKQERKCVRKRVSECVFERRKEVVCERRRKVRKWVFGSVVCGELFLRKW